MAQVIKINSGDNVMVALQPLHKDDIIEDNGYKITLLSDIPQGHKFALADISEKDPVIKYGYRIGVAKSNISTGEWVHTHNMKTALSEQSDYSYNPVDAKIDSTKPSSFMGYIREDGRAAVRNEIWIIPTVGCVNDVCSKLVQENQHIVNEFGIDGIYTFPHPYGCSQMGDDHETTKRILAALAKHPNAGGVLVVGLGCENNTMDSFKEEIGEWNDNHTKFMICQDVSDELETGKDLLHELAQYAGKFKRQPVDVSKLVVGMKCGGSDGLSGITANALVGGFSDKLVSMGGTSILTEVPEMFGAENMLMNRCESKEVFDKAVKMVEDFKNYFVSHGQVVYENPSPGNKQGGITTLEDKSLGCVQKGGFAPVNDVIGYSESVRKNGLTLLSGPGNDLVSTTALTAAGAHIILFTTGRGTPFGAPAPTIKIASNSDLAKRKSGWVDFDAGVIADGNSIDDEASNLMDLVIKTASGEYETKTEKMGYRGIAIFKDGVTL